MKLQFTNYIGLPTKAMPKPYKDAIKNIVIYLNETLKTYNGKTMAVEINIEIR